MTPTHGVQAGMKVTRIAAILGLLTLVACSLYTGDGSERHGGPTIIDAGHGGDCGGGGYPDAGVEDGGGYLPDGGWSNDGGGWGLPDAGGWGVPDAGWSYDGGGYLPDAVVQDAGHH